MSTIVFKGTRSSRSNASIYRWVCRALTIGRDIAAAIGTNPSSQQWGLEEYEQGIAVVETKGGPQAVKTVSASGLISLIFRSKRPEAVEFRKWAYSLVVPYLRLRIVETKGVNNQEERDARREALRVLR